MMDVFNIMEHLIVTIADGLTLALILSISMIVLPTTLLLLLYMAGVVLMQAINILSTCWQAVMTNARELWAAALGGLTGICGLAVDAWSGPILVMLYAVTIICCSLNFPSTPRAPRSALLLLLVCVVTIATTSAGTTTVTGSSTSLPTPVSLTAPSSSTSTALSASSMTTQPTSSTMVHTKSSVSLAAPSSSTSTALSASSMTTQPPSSTTVRTKSSVSLAAPSSSTSTALSASSMTTQPTSSTTVHTKSSVSVTAPSSSTSTALSASSVTTQPPSSTMVHTKSSVPLAAPSSSTSTALPASSMTTQPTSSTMVRTKSSVSLAAPSSSTSTALSASSMTTQPTSSTTVHTKSSVSLTAPSSSTSTALSASSMTTQPPSSTMVHTKSSVSLAAPSSSTSTALSASSMTTQPPSSTMVHTKSSVLLAAPSSSTSTALSASSMTTPPPSSITVHTKSSVSLAAPSSSISKVLSASSITTPAPSSAMTMTPPQASSSPSPTVHCGPAGSTYSSMRSSGQQLLSTHCNNFPNTTKSFVLPPSNNNKFTEPFHRPRPNLTKKEENQLIGLKRNLDGEMDENATSDIFVRMIQQIDISPPILVLRNITVDSDHKHNTRAHALMREIRGLNFQGVPTKGENDILVLVQNTGIVLIEVKRSPKHTNVKVAEEQLKRMNWFIQCIFRAVTGDSTRTFPVLQFIIIPNESSPSPTTPTPEGSRLVYKDICDNFNKYWKTFLNKELMNAFASYPITTNEFTELTEIFAGIWSSKPIRLPINVGRTTFGIVCDESNASLPKMIKDRNLQIDTAAIATTSKQLLTNIIPTQPNDIFQSSNEIKLFHLTPLQRELFDSHQQCILCGAAGTGKTLMLVFKVLQLKQTSDFRDILILAPYPHTLRIRNILLMNNHTVNMVDTFPPPLSSTGHQPQLHNTSSIYIMTLEDFFHVNTYILNLYDMNQYHLFIDDFQSLRFYSGITTSFYDVGDFIEKWYETFCDNGMYFWVLMDVVQDVWLSGGDDGQSSDYFYLTPQHSRRIFNIPILHLDLTMRSTTDLTTLYNEHRHWCVDYYINPNKSNILSHVTSIPDVGHNISGQVPTHHILRPCKEEQHIINFFIERIREVLLLVTKPPFSLPLSEVAILWDEDDDTFITAVQAFLHNEFKTTTVTIAQQLDSNNTHDIIMDTWINVPSFESPCVIYILAPGINSFYDYSPLTRARTHLTIIDTTTGDGFQPFKHTNIVHWKQHNNTFIRYDVQDEPHEQLLEEFSSPEAVEMIDQL